jgi:hypothetical protein
MRLFMMTIASSPSPVHGRTGTYIKGCRCSVCVLAFDKQNPHATQALLRAEAAAYLRIYGTPQSFDDAGSF